MYRTTAAVANCPSAEQARLLNAACRAALAAGAILRDRYEQPHDITLKGAINLVTEADLAAEAAIVALLAAATPEVAVMTEETAATHTLERSGRFWVVDPLDGTKECVRGSDEFTVNIALIDNLEPVLGVIYVPAQELLYYAEKDAGSWRRRGDEQPVRIFSSAPDLSKGLTVVESKSHPSAELEDYLKDLPVKERVSAGSSLKFCLVAEGLADIYPRMNPTMEWDVAAGDCIYRNSARLGRRTSSLTYNKPTLKNGSFVVGFR